MENFNIMPSDIETLRHHRQEANKVEARLVKHINHNAKSLVALTGQYDLDSVDIRAIFDKLYEDGYTSSVGIFSVINTAQEIVHNRTSHNMRIVKTKSKILLDNPYGGVDYALPFWMGLSEDEFAMLLEHVKSQAVAHGAHVPDMSKKKNALDELNKTLQEIGDKFISGKMDIVDYMSESNKVAQEIKNLRSEINAIEQAQS